MQIMIITPMSTQINKNCSIHHTDFHLRVFDKRKERKKPAALNAPTPAIDRCWWRAGGRAGGQASLLMVENSKTPRAPKSILP
jgi:hypothetical protein